MLARRTGLRKLTVRAVAERAQVNLGSFVYHFGTRDAFAEALIERWYAPLWAKLQLTVDAELAPIERYRQLVLCLCDWVAANRAFVGHLLMDAAAHEAAALRFMRTLIGRHPALIVTAIRDAQAAGEMVPGEPMHLMAFTMAATGAPILIGHGLASGRLVRADVARSILGFAIGRDQIEQRLQWIIAGIGVAKEGP